MLVTAKPKYFNYEVARNQVLAKGVDLVLAGFCHAIIGTALHRVLEMHMRIGPFYWESDKYVYRTLFPALRELIGNAFTTEPLDMTYTKKKVGVDLEAYRINQTR